LLLVERLFVQVESDLESSALEFRGRAGQSAIASLRRFLVSVSSSLFSYEVEESGNATSGYITAIKCHGRVLSETSGELKNLVRPLIARGGQITLDFADVTGIDSSGLGTLVGLKVSAIGAGYCTLELVNLSPRVQELLKLTKLTQMFGS
jgi:anti-anti-sigma factor